MPAIGQSNHDWRTAAGAENIELVENWERHFDLAIERAARLRPQAFYEIDYSALRHPQKTLHRIDLETLRALKQADRTDAFPAKWAGLWPCRFILATDISVARYQWMQCRLSRDGTGWRIEKRSGTRFFKGGIYADPALGTAFLGSAWMHDFPETTSGDGVSGVASGVFRIAEGRWLRLFLPGADAFAFIEMDMSQRLRR